MTFCNSLQVDVTLYFLFGFLIIKMISLTDIFQTQHKPLRNYQTLQQIIFQMQTDPDQLVSLPSRTHSSRHLSEDQDDYSPLSIKQQQFYQQKHRNDGDATMRQSRPSNKYDLPVVPAEKNVLERELYVYREKVAQIQLEQQQLAREVLEANVQDLREYEQRNHILMEKLQEKDQELDEAKQEITLRDQAIDEMNQNILYMREALQELEYTNNQQAKYIDSFQHDKSRKQQDKFCQSVLDMVRSCNSEKDANLKYAWRWLKFVLDDYMRLKKSEGMPIQLMRQSDTIMRTKSNDRINTVQVNQLIRNNQKENRPPI